MTEVGKQVIKEMNRVGMVVDCSHSSNKTCIDATPSNMGKPGEVWGVTKELEMTFGWTKDEIRGFLGENLLRVYKANWK